jgi:hypothetical protein
MIELSVERFVPQPSILRGLFKNWKIMQDSILDAHWS